MGIVDYITKPFSPEAITGIVRHTIDKYKKKPMEGEEDTSLLAKAPAAEDPFRPSPVAMRLSVIGLGISGFTSFAYEIYWTRSLVFILGNSVYALTTMLSAFLTGIALGGWLVRHLITRFPDRTALFGWIQVLLGGHSAVIDNGLEGTTRAATREEDDVGTRAPFVLCGWCWTC